MVRQQPRQQLTWHVGFCERVRVFRARQVTVERSGGGVGAYNGVLHGWEPPGAGDDEGAVAERRQRARRPGTHEGKVVAHGWAWVHLLRQRRFDAGTHAEPHVGGKHLHALQAAPDVHQGVKVHDVVGAVHGGFVPAGRRAGVAPR